MCEDCDSVNNFVDTLWSDFLLPQTLLPRMISTRSALIDNIFCNLICSANTLSGNVTSNVTLAKYIKWSKKLIET